MSSPNNKSGFSNTDEKKSGFGSFSSSKGFGGGFSAKIPKRQQVIIEEVESGPKKIFDFDPRQVDSSLVAPKDHLKTAMVGFIVLISCVFGGFIGFMWQGVLSDRQLVNDRIDVSIGVEQTIKPKVDAFQSFAQIFKQRSESLGAGVLEYNERFYNETIKGHRSLSYALDVSTELPPETIKLASNSKENPLADIRAYGAGTMLLSNLLDSHITQTELDIDEINALLGKSSATDRNIVYALKIDNKGLFNLIDKGERTAEAIRSLQVLQVKRAITDDEMASKVFEELKASGRLTDEDIKERQFNAVADAAKRAKKGSKPVVDESIANLSLPNRLMYVIEDRNGKEEIVFSNEIILIERSKLFAGSANALERYRKRMMQILQLLGDIEKSTDGLLGKLHAISTEEKI